MQGLIFCLKDIQNCIYTEDDLVRIRSVYSSKEIFEYFDLDEEDKEYLKKIDECLRFILEINRDFGYIIPEEDLVSSVFRALKGLGISDIYDNTISSLKEKRKFPVVDEE